MVKQRRATRNKMAGLARVELATSSTRHMTEASRVAELSTFPQRSFRKPQSLAHCFETIPELLFCFERDAEESYDLSADVQERIVVKM
jgi:hypothetical protein